MSLSQNASTPFFVVLLLSCPPYLWDYLHMCVYTSHWRFGRMLFCKLHLAPLGLPFQLHSNCVLHLAVPATTKHNVTTTILKSWHRFDHKIFLCTAFSLFDHLQTLVEPEGVDFEAWTSFSEHMLQVWGYVKLQLYTVTLMLQLLADLLLYCFLIHLKQTPLRYGSKTGFSPRLLYQIPQYLVSIHTADEMVTMASPFGRGAISKQVKIPVPCWIDQQMLSVALALR